MDQTRKCPSCGGTTLYKPGFNCVVCQSCGRVHLISELLSKTYVEEKDFLTAENTASHDWGMEAKLVLCKNCGGVTIQNKLQLSGFCPFCGSTTVDSGDPSRDIMAPQGIIPFRITELQAYNIFKSWISNRTLAPERLSGDARLNKFYPIYVPLFTFDVLTFNRYTARTSQDGGQYFKSGKFQFQVDDFPVVASKQLSSDQLLKNVIKSYRTYEAKPYTPDALAGFPCEQYSIGLKEAWNGIGKELSSHLKSQLKRRELPWRLSGIEISTSYYNLKYKYLIVPVWLNSFFYEKKLYTIVINGQTGQIDGQWPKQIGSLAALFLLRPFGTD